VKLWLHWVAYGRRLLKPGGVSLFVLIVEGLVVSSSALTIVQKSAAAIALLLGLFQVANSLTRRHIGHWGNRDLRSRLRKELFWAGLMLLLIATAGFVFPPRPWLLAVFVVLFTLVALPYEVQQKTIFDIIEADPKLEHTTHFIAKLKPWGLWGSDVTLAEGSNEASGRLQQLLAIPLRPSPRERLSMTRWAILSVLTYCLAMLAVTAVAAVGTHLLLSHKQHRKAATAGYAGTKAGEGKSAGKGSQIGARMHVSPADGTPAAASTPSVNERTWESTCGSLPSYGAPEWAQVQLNALYLGGPLYFEGQPVHAELPPGAEGGCTGKAIVPTYTHGEFVYTVGGATRSIAVDSERFGPAIFLAPAAQLVRSMIEEQLGPVGGTPREKVANGDFLSISSELGRTMLVRQQEHLEGRPDQAYPYTELPPSAAEAWVQAMRNYHTWLWPYLSASGGGSETFALARNPISRLSVENIVYSRQERSAGDEGQSYQPHEYEFTLAEVAKFAKLAEVG
jgi:hypothetical protein